MKMISGGYILQPRTYDQSESAKMPPVARELWLYLLRKVNHKDSGKYKRGMGFFCLSDVQNDLCWFVGYRKEMYSKPQLTKSLRRLCERNMIETAKATRGLLITVLNYDYYQNPKNYESNGEGSTKETRRKREGHTKNKNVKNEECKEVIIYLNEKSRKNFKPVGSNYEPISARLSEGYSVDDLKRAIDNQCRDWLGNREMEKYLRPSTLFSKSKFDGYVNNIHLRKVSGFNPDA